MRLAEDVLRARRTSDLPVLLAVLQGHHEREGYPVRAAAVSAQWLASDAELWSAVAVEGDRVVGHVALHPRTDPWPPGVAVVSRLFTDRSVPGAGAALLAGAVAEARARGLAPVLQVDPDAPARQWYRRRGWRETGTARQQWGHRLVDAVLMEPDER